MSGVTMLQVLLLLVALILAVLAGIGVPAGRVSLLALAFAAYVGAVLAPVIATL